MTDVVRRTLLTSVAATAIAAVAAAASAQSPAASGGLTLTAAVERALQANPTIAAARLQRPIDVAGLTLAGERPNPEIAYEFTRETPRQAITATVPIELGGKRQRRVDLANATVAVGEAELAKIVTDIRNDVRRAYFEVVAADTRVQIADDVRALAQRARDAANARVTAGDVPRSDLTQSELTLATSESDLIEARGEAAATRAELNALLGQPIESPVDLIDTLTGGDLPTAQDALARATSTNVELQVLERRIAEQQARVALAQAMRTPDVAAGGGVAYDAGEEFRAGWRVSVGVTLPLFANHKAGVMVEEATLARLRREREASVSQLSGAITAALTRAASMRELVQRYQSVVLPLAVEAERQAQVAYTAGQIGSPVLVQALQTARETRQRGLDASLAYQKALADLEKAIGAAVR
ncbi:MAG: TolC family protein [Vicinamibacterales bacterium]